MMMMMMMIILMRMLQAACAQSNLKRCTLELGGKSPLVVFDDVEDLDQVHSLHFKLSYLHWLLHSVHLCPGRGALLRHGLHQRRAVLLRRLQDLRPRGHLRQVRDQ